MERLNDRDRRFLLICVAVILVCGAITLAFFRRAFPEASIDFRVNRTQARGLAERFLGERGWNVAGHRFAGRFSVEEEAKVYLERELGLERASAFYGADAKVWRWEMRWFRSGVKEEQRVSFTPRGDLAGFESVRREDAPGPSLSLEAARAISKAFLASRGLSSDLTAIEATPIARPNRTDWVFVDERPGFRMRDATVRYSTALSGTELTGYREFVHVPESWERDYRKLRSKNETANLVGNFALFLTFLAMLGVLISKIVLRDVRWRLVGAFAGVAFVLTLLSRLNDLPLSLFHYDTASPLSSFLANRILFGVGLAAISVAAGIAFIVASAEPMYRERFPEQQSLSGMFSRRGLRSRRFFLGVVLGYALAAFFFAYQVVFYIAAARLGAWAPSDVKYDDILSTAFPWVTVLLIGFLPAVVEEGSSRMFSISFLDKLGAGRFVAVVLPAFIWGFNHAAYPNQPFYIRGVEVGLAGCAIGWLMLRFGVLPLLVWHFTVDALYTALLLLRSGNAYYVVTAAICSLILLAPAAVSLLYYARRGGFQSEGGLTNADEGYVRPAEAPAAAPEEVPVVRRVPRRTFAIAGAVALLLGLTFLFPSARSARLVEDAIGRAGAEMLARAFLATNRIATAPFRAVTYSGNGFADDGQVRGMRPDESGRIPGYAAEDAEYVVQKGGITAFERVARDRLPLTFWVTRFFRPLAKEEWKVLVDSRRARVIGFVNPVEESAPAGPAPTADRARERALDAARRLGYPASAYSLLEVGTRDRPKRKDTTVVLESREPGLGEARPRLTAVFHGSRLAAFYPSIHVPESFLRARRRQSLFEPLLLAVKIGAIGSLIGVGAVLFLRLLKRTGLAWKRMVPGLALVALFAGAALANSARSLLRAYPTDTPLTLFLTGSILVLVLVWILILSAAAIGFVLFSGARPGWRRALRAGGALSDALARAAISAVGLLGLGRVTAMLTRRVPELFDPQPALPSALERAVPSFAVLWSASSATFVAAAVAALFALGAREAFLQKKPARILVVLALVISAVPASFHGSVEFLGGLVPALLTLGWLGVAAFALLRDHAAAWVLFGAVAFGFRGAAELLMQPAAPDRSAGAAALLLVLLCAAALVWRRRNRRALTTVEAGAGGLP